ncbi:MAG TPA: EAL domain-containing protein, partial [Candidatus Baltobacteraceae bacterium]|nr:EAL domain-containing protein [Candidatus Baltobacteraceae bacterium]
MSPQAETFYKAWLEKNAYVTVLIYCGLIIFLLPVFHFALQIVPGVTGDSMATRMVSVLTSAAIAIALLLVPRTRKHALHLQFVNVTVALLVIVALIVQHHDHYAYVAAGLLVIVGAQQAFYRPTDLIATITIGFLFQIAYSYSAGFLTDPVNVATLVIYGSGYILAFVPAFFRMQIQQRELLSRIEAIEVRGELEQVHAITHLGNWQVDLITGETDWSAEMMRIFRMPLETPAEKLRGVFESSIHPDDRDDVEAAFERSMRERVPFTVEHRVFTADYTMRWVQVQGQHQFDSAGNALQRLAVVLDITERKHAEERLRNLAAFDQLTNLPNRATLEQHLRDALAIPDAHCSILFLDLDRFKDINDSLGHAVGDAMLCAVSERLLMMLPEGGTLARWGGDEFLMLVHDTDDMRIERLAHQLIRSIVEPFSVEQYELVITGSIGIARAPKDGTDVGVLIRNADTAMYYAKERSREAYAFFQKSMHDAAAARHHVQNELHKAIRNNRLMLHYQPIIDISTGKVIAAEALLRWIGPDGSVRTPEDFITIAEDTGEIVPIGTWALQDACRQIKAWQLHDQRISVAVNVSARQLEHPEFLDTLSLILRQSSIDPSLLDIEVTETALLSNTDALFDTLAMIRSLGPRISIDDFGTGYSTFAYLKRFKVDALKLDGSFVNGIDRIADRAIAESIVKVAHALGLRVIAEGVEHESQLHILSEMR